MAETGVHRQELATVACRGVVEDQRALEAEGVAVRRARRAGAGCHRPVEHRLRTHAGLAIGLVGEHLGQHRPGRGHRHRVAVERADLVVAAVADRRHHLVRAADRTARQTAAECLGKTDDVGSDAEQPGRSAGVHAETGLDFVEGQQHAVLAGQSANTGEIVGLRRDDAGVHHHRLHDHARRSNPRCACSTRSSASRSLNGTRCTRSAIACGMPAAATRYGSSAGPSRSRLRHCDTITESWWP